jgi:hypothetical protein
MPKLTVWPLLATAILIVAIGALLLMLLKALLIIP